MRDFYNLNKNTSKRDLTKVALHRHPKSNLTGLIDEPKTSLGMSQRKLTMKKAYQQLGQSIDVTKSKSRDLKLKVFNIHSERDLPLVN